MNRESRILTIDGKMSFCINDLENNIPNLERPFFHENSVNNYEFRSISFFLFCGNAFLSFLSLTKIVLETQNLRLNVELADTDTGMS